MVRYFVSVVANVEARDAAGRTPLVLLASNGYDEAVAALVEAGADIEAADDERRTALERLMMRLGAVGAVALAEATACVEKGATRMPASGGCKWWQRSVHDSPARVATGASTARAQPRRRWRDAAAQLR